MDAMETLVINPNNWILHSMHVLISWVHYCFEDILFSLINFVLHMKCLPGISHLKKKEKKKNFWKVPIVFSSLISSDIP